MRKCPRCDAMPYLCNTGAKYRCRGCGHQYTEKSGTLFHRSKLPMEKLYKFIELVKEGKNANQISKILKVQYKTAFNLHHKIYESLGN